MEKVFLTPQEARKMLGISSNAMYELLECGSIPATRIGTRWKIQRDELIEWSRRICIDEAKERAKAKEERS